MTGPGDNSRDPELLAYKERIDRIDDQISELSEDRKELLAEMKAKNIDTAIFKKVIRRANKHRSEVEAEDNAIIDMERRLGIGVFG